MNGRIRYGPKNIINPAQEEYEEWTARIISLEVQIEWYREQDLAVKKENKRLREALERIEWYSHDQPAALNVSREEWEARRAGSMQQIAHKALKGEEHK